MNYVQSVTPSGPGIEDKTSRLNTYRAESGDTQHAVMTLPGRDRTPRWVQFPGGRTAPGIAGPMTNRRQRAHWTSPV